MTIEPEVQVIPEVPSEKLKPKLSKKKSNATTLDEEVKKVDEEPVKPKKPTIKKKAISTEDLASMAGQLQALHMMAAVITKIPELQLSSGEAEALAKSLAEVQKEFGFQISGKTAAIIGLIGTGAMIYLPRAPSISANINEKKRKLKEKRVVPVEESNEQAQA